MLAVHLAYAIDRWRRSNGQLAADWLEAAGEFEALCCLAGYAYEHPEYPFPAIEENGPCLEAEGLGHPLISAKRRVSNDVHLGRAPQLLLVSGSNMSGKSTLLRTVGVNTVLALAGAPVCAGRDAGFSPGGRVGDADSRFVAGRAYRASMPKSNGCG